MLRRQMDKVDRQVEIVQYETGFLATYLKKVVEPIEHRDANRGPDFNDLHQILAMQHANLTNGFSNFLQDLGEGCRAALRFLEVSESALAEVSKQSAHSELQLMLSTLSSTAAIRLQHRDRLLQHVETQLKVVRPSMLCKLKDADSILTKL